MTTTDRTVITAGLDLSLTGTGICVLENRESILHTIKTGPRDFPTIYDRIDHIVSRIEFYVPATTDMVCIEAPFVRVMRGSIDSSSKSLIALSHMVRRRLTQLGIPFIDVAASQLKKFILGKGSGDKSQVLKEVFKRYKVDAADDNQADACVLAHIAEAVFNTSWSNLAKYQSEVVQKLLRCE